MCCIWIYLDFETVISWFIQLAKQKYLELSRLRNRSIWVYLDCETVIAGYIQIAKQQYLEISRLRNISIWVYLDCETVVCGVIQIMEQQYLELSRFLYRRRIFVWITQGNNQHDSDGNSLVKKINVYLLKSNHEINNN